MKDICKVHMPWLEALKNTDYVIVNSNMQVITDVRRNC